MSKHVVIIGGGVAGLSAAIRLAVSGWQVELFEQNPSLGGKMGQIERDGFRWDTGPSVITMRSVFEELFQVANRNLTDYLQLEPLEPLTRYFYPNNTRLDASSHLPRMASEIEAIEPQDVAGYLRYLAYAAEIHRITAPVFIYNQPPRLQDILSVPLPDMPKVDPLRTMNGAINSFVKSPELRQLLGRFATYTGASPYLAPATLNVIAHVELTQGVWYPQGGIYSITTALAKLAAELGVTLHVNSGVDKITTEGARVTGVTLQDGRHIPADAVIANLDVALVYERMLAASQSHQQTLAEITQLEPSCSGFILLLGINKTHPELAHHNIFFSSDYPAEFKAIFEQGIPPQDPTIYVAITSKTDPSHAPDDAENWFILVNAPPLDERYDWQAQAPAYRDLILEKLAARGFDVRANIISETVLTPNDLERLTGARRGALYGVSSNSKWTAFRRPHNRAKGLHGLYFAGGTTHPGGGVPMVMLSAKSAVNMLLSDFA